MSKTSDFEDYINDALNKADGEMEVAAMHACLAPLGEYVGSIGMQRPLADYSREEVLTMIDVVVTAFQERMVAEHERMTTRSAQYLSGRLIRSKGVR